jgi:sigma-B regulation protein RsbU (phosphoserine phosphatase)
MDNNSLKDELDRLQIEKASLQVQEKLFESFVEIARTSNEVEMKSTLQKTLDISTEQTGAEKGAIFLFDGDGKVTDSIITREVSESETQSKLIGVVLDKGLAGWVIKHREAGLITDTENDARWLTLPDQPYMVRSALAVPIVRGDDVLGVITLLHSELDRFTQNTVALMRGTADHIGLALENIRLYVKLTESHRSLEKAKKSAEDYAKALDAELERGKQIQKNFLPSHIQQVPGWEFASCFYPAHQVSGDFYDVFSLPGNLVGFVIGDVCDKGVGSALYMALFRSLLRVFSGAHRLQDFSGLFEKKGLADAAPDREGGAQVDPLDAVAITNDYISRVHGSEAMFATIFFGVLNPETGLVRYINGGHEPLLVVKDGLIKQILKPTGPAVGMLPQMDFRKEQIKLEPGAMLIGYTDGVSEASSPEGELFSKWRLEDILKRPASSATDLLEHLKKELDVFIAGMPQSDDITLLFVRRIPTR